MATRDVEVGGGDSIGHAVQFLLDCKEKGRDLSNRRPPLIFMVPSEYRDRSPRSFNPRLVSIGPLHRRDKNLHKFEVQKMTYLHHLLDRSSSNPEQTLKECVRKVSMKIEEIKACYEETTTYNDEELAIMMVIDGCFILYFIHLFSEKDGPLANWSIVPLIALDLALIENQIPFFVLQDVFESTILQFKPNTSLINHIKILLQGFNFFQEHITTSNISVDTTHDHILGLLHKFLQPAHDFPSASYSYPKSHSALELDRAGVNFVPNEDANWAVAMKLELPTFSCFPWFWCKPTLRMPKLHVHDSTELILRNLIMYEQACLGNMYVTAYAWAMDTLIDTAEDVAKLIKSGVLINDCGSNEDAANMINSICQAVSVSDSTFYYHQQWQDLDTHYNSYWPNAAAGLKRKYFNSPWNMVALFTGIILFILTIVQTIFTIKAANPIVTKH